MRAIGVWLAFLLAVAAAAPAQTKPPLDSVLDALEAVKSFKQASLSPDGTRVAWVERRRDAKGREIRSAIFVAQLPSGAPRRVSAAKDARDHREEGVAFSPDGKSLAFLSDAGSEHQLQLWVAPSSGGGARRVTAVSGQLSDPKWSPDGKSIAFLFIEGSTQEPGALVPYRPDSGVVEEKIEEQRIAVANVASGKVRLVSSADLYVYDYDWSPDGTRFAAEAAAGSGTNNYWIAELYVVRADSGESRSVWKPPLQIACPRFSPDGRTIAVIHGLMSDEGATGGDIWLVPAGGGTAKNATPDLPASATALFWRSPTELLFTEQVDGDMGLASLDPNIGTLVTLWRGPASVSSVTMARAGGVAAIVSSSRRAPEVFAGAPGAWKAISNANTGVPPFWGDAASLHWKSDGQTVQGWLVGPKGTMQGGRYPLVVSVHGGPSSAVAAGWPSRWNAVLPAEGYYVLQPNPRGSYGRGEAFTQGNVKDFGHGDLRDILAGVDEAIRQAPIDPERIGILGWSYGGYMTMWAVTQTQRFKAAVAGAGIADWRSYYGQNRIDRWMIPFFGASVYQDPAVYEKSSPMPFIKNVRTPTLVLHGDRDSEVPTSQGYEFWHAVKTLGVPTQLVIYENEGHGIRDPAHQRDIQRRTIEWFEKYLK